MTSDYHEKRPMLFNYEMSEYDNRLSQFKEKVGPALPMMHCLSPQAMHHA